MSLITQRVNKLVGLAGGWRGTTRSRQSALHATSSALLARGSQKRHITIQQLNSDRDGRERVVILGSGWAGYTFARRLNRKKFQAVLVSPRSYFVFTPLLASTSVGTLEFRTALEPVRSRRTKAAFFQGWADAVDFNNRTVTIEEAVDDPLQGLGPVEDRHEGESKDESEERRVTDTKRGKLFDLKYDKLVITVGCYSQTFGTPGVKEHALFLKDVGDARRTRNRLLACFETAALPTTSERMKKNLLNFAVVGGGPTGIEFSAELHDLITEDMAKLYPELTKYCQITVYDVAPKILSMFDKKLGEYAMSTFKRDGITIKTEHHVEELRRGVPKVNGGEEYILEDRTCWTLKVKEEGEIGVGMVVWSTGLMMNPFVEKVLGEGRSLPDSGFSVDKSNIPNPTETGWVVRRHPRSGAILTNDRLRVKMEPEGAGEKKPYGILKDVYALGDCGAIEDTALPATAQVANQKAEWLAKRLNKDDIDTNRFTYKDLGIMAYIGNWNAIMQTGGHNISGRAAWLVWRGAYLSKSVSWRNRILIPTYWFLNWLFGRDISRF